MPQFGAPRNVWNGEESGRAAFGKVSGDSRHWAAAGFPKKDRNSRNWPTGSETASRLARVGGEHGTPELGAVLLLELTIEVVAFDINPCASHGRSGTYSIGYSHEVIDILTNPGRHVFSRDLRTCRGFDCFARDDNDVSYPIGVSGKFHAFPFYRHRTSPFISPHSSQQGRS